jgi:GNAT superfamily N-acetyltransferase
LVKWSGKLIVHLDFQNRGIGTRLMNEIEKRFDQAERYELFTGCRSERNLYLYQKLGYEPFRSERATDKVTLTFLEKR